MTKIDPVYCNLIKEFILLSSLPLLRSTLHFIDFLANRHAMYNSQEILRDALNDHAHLFYYSPN